MVGSKRVKALMLPPADLGNASQKGWPTHATTQICFVRLLSHSNHPYHQSRIKPNPATPSAAAAHPAPPNSPPTPNPTTASPCRTAPHHASGAAAPPVPLRAPGSGPPSRGGPGDPNAASVSRVGGPRGDVPSPSARTEEPRVPPGSAPLVGGKKGGSRGAFLPRQVFSDLGPNPGDDL
ncbi:hypothetical protein GUJ93_ZPchr0006g41082 [Zizania palustris]|uniref:Uncharacterized protein n=1 Tax=Zizania palustris TaxID=103762 RepID=A0A8J5SJV6_ZIZPA|nr:hypothetical protein GUJ93_ZPchr0006g41082 [Zizania palustris]